MPPVEAVPGLLPGYVDALRDRESGYILSLACCGAGRKDATGAPADPHGDAADEAARALSLRGAEAPSRA